MIDKCMMRDSIVMKIVDFSINFKNKYSGQDIFQGLISIKPFLTVTPLFINYIDVSRYILKPIDLAPS